MWAYVFPWCRLFSSPSSLREANPPPSRSRTSRTRAAGTSPGTWTTTAPCHVTPVPVPCSHFAHGIFCHESLLSTRESIVTCVLPSMCMFLGHVTALYHIAIPYDRNIYSYVRRISDTWLLLVTWPFTCQAITPLQATGVLTRLLTAKWLLLVTELILFTFQFSVSRDPSDVSAGGLLPLTKAY